jgi:hypothetical protein
LSLSIGPAFFAIGLRALVGAASFAGAVFSDLVDLVAGAATGLRPLFGLSSFSCSVNLIIYLKIE